MITVFDAILRYFPPHTHPLTLVSDRDRLLADEGILTELAQRGFTLVDEPDPARLCCAVHAVRPFSAANPVIVLTAGPLNGLPYDLWQQGHHVTLDLHTFFPTLAYPFLRTLTPFQRWQLSLVALPERPLGSQHTMAFLLRHVFAADAAALRQPAQLVAWLAGYHQNADPMPGELADYLLAQLRPAPALAGWPLAELLGSRDAFAAFIGRQWQLCLDRQSDTLSPPGQPLGESKGGYVLRFETDPALQDMLPMLVRSGALAPIGALHSDRLPNWTRPAVLAVHEDGDARRAAELLALLTDDVSHCALPDDMRWEQWQSVARHWAELSALYDAGQTSSVERASSPDDQYESLQTALDAAFLAWLRERYAPLSGQRLPRPHHLFHVPHYIAYRRRQGQGGRVALLVLDGLSLAAWLRIGAAWRMRHPDWRFEEQLVLAQIPTITAVSRQALISGLRPSAFAETLNSNRREASQWADFWSSEGLPAEACPYAHLALDRDGAPPAMGDPRAAALCLVETRLDDMAHDATLGHEGFYALLPVWLDGYGRQVEQIMAGLIRQGFVVYLTSDHGHVQARGFGQPSEGLIADTRGRRARLYGDLRAAAQVQQGFPATILWHRDGLLPDDVCALIPQGRAAFDTFNQISVTHGGLTLDEVVVPLVTISRAGEG